MKIQIGNTDYFIRSDENNYVLSVLKTRQTGANIGEKYLDDFGYYRFLDQALAGFAEKKIKLSDATTFEQLRKDIKEVHKIIKDIADAVR